MYTSPKPTTTFASAFPPPSPSTSTSSSFSSTSRPPPIRATAFSTQGGGFIVPRARLPLPTPTVHRASLPPTVKVITKTVTVRVPSSSGVPDPPRRIKGLPPSSKAIPIHSPRSSVLPRSLNPTSSLRKNL